MCNGISSMQLLWGQARAVVSAHQTAAGMEPAARTELKRRWKGRWGVEAWGGGAETGGRRYGDPRLQGT